MLYIALELWNYNTVDQPGLCQTDTAATGRDFVCLPNTQWMLCISLEAFVVTHFAVEAFLRNQPQPAASSPTPVPFHPQPSAVGDNHFTPQPSTIVLALVSPTSRPNISGSNSKSMSIFLSPTRSLPLNPSLCLTLSPTPDGAWSSPSLFEPLFIIRTAYLPENES